MDEVLEDDFALTHPVVVGGRASHDHYPTPRWVTLALWHHGLRHGWWTAAQPPASVLDPSCGEGAILDVWAGLGSKTLGYELDASRGEDARRRGHRVEVGDALGRPWAPASILVGNPPYGAEAARFVHQGISWLRDQPSGTRVFFLLYVSFVEPAGDRASLFQEMPPDVAILHRRPKFSKNDTNRTASAWFCWPGTGQNTWLPAPPPPPTPPRPPVP